MTITSQPFAVEVISGTAGLVIRVEGELDLATAVHLDACLAALDADIVVDLADLMFMDATGVAALVAGHGRAVQRGRSFVLRSPTDRTAKVLRLTGVDQVLLVEH